MSAWGQTMSALDGTSVEAAAQLRQLLWQRGRPDKEVQQLTTLLNGRDREITRPDGRGVDQEGDAGYATDDGGLWADRRRARFLARPDGVHPPPDPPSALDAMMRSNGHAVFGRGERQHRPFQVQPRVLWERKQRDLHMAWRLLFDGLSIPQLSREVGLDAKTLRKREMLREAAQLRKAFRAKLIAYDMTTLGLPPADVARGYGVSWDAASRIGRHGVPERQRRLLAACLSESQTDDYRDVWLALLAGLDPQNTQARHLRVEGGSALELALLNEHSQALHRIETSLAAITEFLEDGGQFSREVAELVLNEDEEDVEDAA